MWSYQIDRKNYQDVLHLLVFCYSVKFLDAAQSPSWRNGWGRLKKGGFWGKGEGEGSDGGGRKADTNMELKCSAASVSCLWFVSICKQSRRRRRCESVSMSLSH